jgi:hypothetical protein
MGEKPILDRPYVSTNATSANAKPSPTNPARTKPVARPIQDNLNSHPKKSVVTVGSDRMNIARLSKLLLDNEMTVTARNGITTNRPIRNASPGKTNTGTQRVRILLIKNTNIHIMFVNSEKARHLLA